MTNPSSGGYSPSSEHPEAVRFPLMELPLVGAILAFMAGALNAWTIPNAGTFSTVQSGNVVSLGYWIVQGNWGHFLFPFLSVIGFGVGSAVCGVIMTSMLRKGRSFTIPVLAFMTVLLVLLGILAIVLVGDHHVDSSSLALNVNGDKAAQAKWIAVGISFVAGALGNAYHKDHGMLFGAVAVTFVVQMAFNFLIQSAFKKIGINGEPNLKWSMIFFSVLLGFTAGGAAGFGIDKWFNGASIFLVAVIALAIIAKAAALGSKNVDPTPGGSFA